MRCMLALASALTVVLLFSGRALASDDCVCGAPEASPFGGWEALLESTDPRLLMDRMVDPATLETSDPYAVRGVAPSTDDRAPQVSWCAHADDPRCSPLQHEEDPRPSLGSSGPSFLLVAPAQLERREVVDAGATPTAHFARTARNTGEHHVDRVERPPRA